MKKGKGQTKKRPVQEIISILKSDFGSQLLTQLMFSGKSPNVNSAIIYHFRCKQKQNKLTRT